MSLNIGTKRERAFTSVHLVAQNKKRIQKMLEKSYCEQAAPQHDQRQRHLLSKRTRIAADNTQKQLCDKLARNKTE
jgi:hypothetical protein